MATQYKIQINQSVIQQDLPEELQDDFVRYQQVLAIDPNGTRGIPSHGLTGKLAHYRSIEIDCPRSVRPIGITDNLAADFQTVEYCSSGKRESLYDRSTEFFCAPNVLQERRVMHLPYPWVNLHIDS